MINSKLKPCKGTGKAKGHGCGKPQLYRKYGLGTECKCWQNFLLTTEQGKEIINKAKISSAKKVKAEKKKQDKEFKEQNKSIQKLIQEARIPFQKYIRARDANIGCMACGKTDSKIWDAGHFYKAELYSGLIFDERNVHKCCRKCNTYLNGNEGEYRKRLLERFGQKWLDTLDEDANKLRSYKYERDELREIKKKYTELLKTCYTT